MDKRIYKIGQLTIKIAGDTEAWMNCKAGRKYLLRIDRAKKQIKKLIKEINSEKN